MQLHDRSIQNSAFMRRNIFPLSAMVHALPTVRSRAAPPEMELLHRCDSQPSASARRAYIGMFMPRLMTRPPLMYLPALKYLS